MITVKKGKSEYKVSEQFQSYYTRRGFEVVDAKKTTAEKPGEPSDKPEAAPEPPAEPPATPQTKPPAKKQATRKTAPKTSPEPVPKPTAEQTADTAQAVGKNRLSDGLSEFDAPVDFEDNNGRGGSNIGGGGGR